MSRAIAWTGAVLFAASLGYFVLSYAVTWGEIASGPVLAGDIAANVALFSMFALHHSVFARERVRAWVADRVTPALERSLYVWVASLMLIGVCALWRPIPGVVWQVPAPWAWALPLVQVAGIWLSIRSAAAIDVWELAGVRQVQGRPEGRPQIPVGRGRPSGRPETFEFTTTGPYGWIRHPIYLGWFLIVFAVGTMTMTRLVFAVVSGLYVLIGIHFEERSLRRTSGGAYDAYMRQVPHKLLPGVY